MQLVLDKGITDRPLPNDCHFIDTKASLVYWFESGSHVSLHKFLAIISGFLG